MTSAHYSSLILFYLFIIILVISSTLKVHSLMILLLYVIQLINYRNFNIILKTLYIFTAFSSLF